MLKRKLREWLKRYLPAEIVGTLTALFAASFCHTFSNNHILIAYTGTVGEAIGFYLTIFIQYTWGKAKERRLKNDSFHYYDIIHIGKVILLEFGLASLLDDLLLRPFFMYLFPIILDNFTIGILLGKIVGDITFYMLVIISYELKNKFRKAHAS